MDPMVDQPVPLLDPTNRTPFELADRGRQVVTSCGSRLVENSEPALPRPIAQFDVLPVEGREQGFEPAYLLELQTIEHCRTTPRKHRIERSGPAVTGRDIALMNTNKASRKAAHL